MFGTNQYYSDWNTYLLTLMGDQWSIQWTQSAAKNGAQYIAVSGDRLEAKSIARDESYTVKIVRKGDDTGIEGVVSKDEGIIITDDGIIAANNIRSIAVYSADGKLVKKCDGNAIVVTGIARGVYIAVTDNGSERKQYKFIIR